MTQTSPTVTEAELHAYADGQTTDADRVRIEAWLTDHPEELAMVTEWKSQNTTIRAMFEPYAEPRPGDASLLVRSRPARRSWLRHAGIAASVAAIFTAGALSGRYGPALFEKPERRLASSETLPRQAQNAFLVYASEERHPVEVFANEEAHLAKWLGSRLAIQNLTIPDLKILGFRLVGGRLLPVDGKPGAMFMYEDRNGERLTVIVLRNAENRTTSFRYALTGDLETFYWIDGEIGYAVTGEISRALLRQVADECYRQFSR